MNYSVACYGALFVNYGRINVGFLSSPLLTSFQSNNFYTILQRLIVKILFFQDHHELMDFSILVSMPGTSSSWRSSFPILGQWKPLRVSSGGPLVSAWPSGITRRPRLILQHVDFLYQKLYTHPSSNERS